MTSQNTGGPWTRARLLLAGRRPGAVEVEDGAEDVLVPVEEVLTGAGCPGAEATLDPMEGGSQEAADSPVPNPEVQQVCLWV